MPPGLHGTGVSARHGINTVEVSTDWVEREVLSLARSQSHAFRVLDDLYGKARRRHPPQVSLMW